jgi:biopolymer transport protein ExbB
MGLRIASLVVVCLGILMSSPMVAWAQESGTTRETETSAAIGGALAPGAEDGIPEKPTLVDMLFAGSLFGVGIVLLIIVLSVISLYFVIVYAATITRQRLLPERVLVDLERMLAEGEVNSAIVYCHEPENWSLATEVVAAGLQRYQSSEFGFAEYRSAVEEAGEDLVGRLYRKTEVLNVIGSIAPMLGLLGTVVGMIEAFLTIANRGGMAQPAELAGGISQALVTTVQGLVVAIPTMVALSFFRTKIDSLVSEAGKRIERIMLPLGRKK